MLMTCLVGRSKIIALIGGAGVAAIFFFLVNPVGTLLGSIVLVGLSLLAAKAMRASGAGKVVDALRKDDPVTQILLFAPGWLTTFALAMTIASVIYSLSDLSSFSQPSFLLTRASTP